MKSRNRPELRSFWLSGFESRMIWRSKVKDMLGCKERKGNENLIKVIACDLDGTLCDVDHDINDYTAKVVAKAQQAGIRFIVATGRFYEGTMRTVDGVLQDVDLLLNSGAEILNPQGEVVIHRPLTKESIRQIYEVMKDEPLTTKYNGFERNGFVGTIDQLEQQALKDYLTFHPNMRPQDACQDRRFMNMMAKCQAYSSIESLQDDLPEIAKVFCFGGTIEQAQAAKAKLRQIPKIGIASSFPTNIEITDIKAQKGPALKEYIESLGYTMDEVMVFGDSENDLSMMEMDFVTVAMGNAEENIKKVSKYVTKSNDQNGVAWAIEQLLERQGSIAGQKDQQQA